MYSIEYLFQECNLNKKVLHLELFHPVQLEDVMTTELILLKVESDEAKDIAFLHAIKDGINTNIGEFRVVVSDKNGNPLNPQVIFLNLNDIHEIWAR